MELNDQEERFESCLESALKEYGDAEPRRGLGESVLANLRAAELKRVEAGRRWWWAVGMATAAAVIVVLSGLGDKTNRPAKKLVAITTSPAVHVTASDSSGKQQTPVANTEHTMRRHVERDGPQGGSEISDIPKMERFPSPRPLSEREKALFAYVEQFPHEALLIAHARTVLLQKEQEEQKEREILQPHELQLHRDEKVD